MAKVTGIGGLFFRSKDPEALSKWYLDFFGIGNGSDGMPWQQEAGMTVFQPFSADTDYYRADKSHMINFRVDDMATLVKKLRAADISVKQLPDETYGLFAHLEDPEGNPIELWQPLPA